MMANAFNERALFALRRKRFREARDIQQSEVGEAVAASLGREPFSQGTVSGWFAKTDPADDVKAALAAFLDVDPGWLAFGEASQAPAPDGWTTVSARDAEELAEALRVDQILEPEAVREPPHTPPAGAPEQSQGRRSG